jgi:hypothetical protein
MVAHATQWFGIYRFDRFGVFRTVISVQMAETNPLSIHGIQPNYDFGVFLREYFHVWPTRIQAIGRDYESGRSIADGRFVAVQRQIIAVPHKP